MANGQQQFTALSQIATSLLVPLPSKCTCAKEANARRASLVAEINRTIVAQPIADYHEDLGNVVWWRFPVTEPPYVGSPLDTNWPGYHTHFTVLIVPAAPQS